MLVLTNGIKFLFLIWVLTAIIFLLYCGIKYYEPLVGIFSNKENNGFLKTYSDISLYSLDFLPRTILFGIIIIIVLSTTYLFWGYIEKQELTKINQNKTHSTIPNILIEEKNE